MAMNGLVNVRKGQPTVGEMHTNVPLTNISSAYIQNQAVFNASRIFPVVPVSERSNIYYVYNKEDFLRDEAKPRAPGSESAGGGFSVTTANYSTLVEAYHKDIDDQLRANADSVLQLDRAATEFVTQKLLMRRERRWLSTFFTTGVWGNDIAAGGLAAGTWDISTSKPLVDVENGKMLIAANTGFMPNTLLIGARVLSKLRDHPAIRDQFKYTSAESIDTAMLARYFGIDRLVVSNAVFSSNPEGVAPTSTSTDFMAGKHALLCYSAPSPALMQPTAGYTFAWTGYLGTEGIRIRRFRMEEIESDRIEGSIAYDFRKVAAEMGVFYNGVIA